MLIFYLKELMIRKNENAKKGREEGGVHTGWFLQLNRTKLDCMRWAFIRLTPWLPSSLSLIPQLYNLVVMKNKIT